ncbi:hypothetical protein EHQ53_17670 [Leptospira langatensis]|uniref:Addiction module protein n=1 Tax=Leptospira langatensis TaxID=2484983 RepID=A0A5F1ZP32_9LEPT|nr:hypothetical protein [Leptospira langatensis]TGK05643.1 hypothetical protein EHO57_01910 [Leptospira langatensis]TGL38774.1 hypothetical protein EHQ53_17670 [Leptospira langatensis]
MNLLPKITIGELQGMEIEEQIDALSAIWDQIALKNPAIQLSKEEQQLLDKRFMDEQNMPGKSWADLKKQILKSKQ